MSISILHQTFASLYKRKGKDVIKAKDLELLASMELRWFEPAEARKLVAYALSFGVIEDTGDGLKTIFVLDSVEIPLGFRPPENLLSSLAHDEESLFMQLVNQISISTNLDPEKVIAEINTNQAESNDYLTLEVLAILYGKSKGVDLDKYIPRAKSKLLSSTP